ncbi:MAG: hypothetical protein U1V55_04405 [Planktothrix rubescens PR222]
MERDRAFLTTDKNGWVKSDRAFWEKAIANITMMELWVTFLQHHPI